MQEGKLSLTHFTIIHLQHATSSSEVCTIFLIEIEFSLKYLRNEILVMFSNFRIRPLKNELGSLASGPLLNTYAD
jgi:hypothetical protein